MSKRLRILVIVALAIAAIGGIGMFYVFNKPHRNLAKEKADFTYTAHNLFAEFTKNEKQANAKFLNKAIEISGTVKEVSSKSSLVVYSDGNTDGGVQCEMDADHHLSTDGIKVGQKIKLKGQCDGLLLEVILSKCILVQ